MGAPFVLLIFIGFLEVSKASWRSITVSTDEKIRLQKFAQTPASIIPQEFSEFELDQISLLKPKGTGWNLWRIKE